MRLSGWENRLKIHETRIHRLEASGAMAELYTSNRRRFRQAYQRLGYLKQKVESLRREDRSFSNRCYGAFIETLSACGFDAINASAEWDAFMNRT